MKQVFQDLRGTRDRLTSTYLTIVLISAGVFLIGFTITSIFARTVAVQNKADYQTELTQQAQTVRLQVSERLSGYKLLLYSALSQFAAKPDLSHEDWTQFYNSMQVQRQYPSVLALGYVEMVPASETGALEESVKANGFSSFTIHPQTIHDTAAIIKYIEPFEGINLKAYGFDMYTSENRKAAMMIAGDTAEPAMSRPVKLIQDGEGATAYGSLLYLPVYKGNVTPDSVDARRSQLQGFVYVAFRPSDIMSRIVGSSPQLNDDMNIALKSISSDTGQVLYAANYSSAPARSLTTTTKDITASGQTWQISIAGQDQAINQFYGPLGLFFLGAGASVLIALIVYFALMNRLSRVQKVYEEDVENTKSELLALASHQLRTPATGVKQYLGILREGIMGQLTPSQLEMVEKAFDTNERQLHVINDLLYVSKVDAGQLMIDPVITDVTKITSDVIANLKSKAEEKDITVVFSAKKPVVITADDRYVGMIIENLISNAIKYSYESSKVRVSLKLEGGAMTMKVSDKGVGIAPEDIERAFNKFNRIENPLSRHEGGSGLGLFLANQLAKGHGGTIDVEPSRGRGTTFVLTLPSVAMIDHDIVNLADPHKRGKRLTGRRLFE